VLYVVAQTSLSIMPVSPLKPTVFRAAESLFEPLAVSGDVFGWHI
jgi:hypothetical protein